MARVNRGEARRIHSEVFKHEFLEDGVTTVFKETIYGVICRMCSNYIMIDRTNCPSTCDEHETCIQAYGNIGLIAQ